MRGSTTRPGRLALAEWRGRWNVRSSAPTAHVERIRANGHGDYLAINGGKRWKMRTVSIEAQDCRTADASVRGRDPQAELSLELDHLFGSSEHRRATQRTVSD